MTEKRKDPKKNKPRKPRVSKERLGDLDLRPGERKTVRGGRAISYRGGAGCPPL